MHKVFTKETFNSTTKTVIYCNIISDDLAQLSAESKYIYDVRTIRCGIYAVALQGLDSNNAGTGAIMHGSVVEKIDKVIDTLAATLPTATTADEVPAKTPSAQQVSTDSVPSPHRHSMPPSLTTLPSTHM